MFDPPRISYWADAPQEGCYTLSTRGRDLGICLQPHQSDSPGFVPMNAIDFTDLMESLHLTNGYEPASPGTVRGDCADFLRENIKNPVNLGTSIMSGDGLYTISHKMHLVDDLVSDPIRMSRYEIKDQDMLIIGLPLASSAKEIPKIFEENNYFPDAEAHRWLLNLFGDHYNNLGLAIQSVFGKKGKKYPMISLKEPQQDPKTPTEYSLLFDSHGFHIKASKLSTNGELYLGKQLLEHHL